MKRPLHAVEAARAAASCRTLCVSQSPSQHRTLPDPVCPYAKHVVLPPLNRVCTSGLTVSVYTRSLPMPSSRASSNTNAWRSTYLVRSTLSCAQQRCSMRQSGDAWLPPPRSAGMVVDAPSPSPPHLRLVHDDSVPRGDLEDVLLASLSLLSAFKWDSSAHPRPCCGRRTARPSPRRCCWHS